MNTLGNHQTRRHTWHLVAGFATMFILGDLILGFMRLPGPDGSTNMVRRKWERLRDAAYNPDVVILGSSFEEFGVNPAVLDEQVKHTLGRDVTSYNLAVPAASLNTEFLLVRDMLRSKCRPRVAYLGITPLAVDVAQREWLHNGLRAFGEFEDLLGVWGGNRSVFAETLATSVFRSYYLWNDARLMSERLVMAAPIHSNSAIDEGARGWCAWRGKQRPQSHRSTPDDCDESGWQRRFALDNLNGIRVRDAIDALRRSGIQVRLLELPLASTALDLSAPRKNEHYRAFVESLIAAADVPLVRPPNGLLVDEDYFDDGHLTPDGAEKLSRWLARDVSEALSEPKSRVATR